MKLNAVSIDSQQKNNHFFPLDENRKANEKISSFNTYTISLSLVYFFVAFGSFSRLTTSLFTLATLKQIVFAKLIKIR